MGTRASTPVKAADDARVVLDSIRRLVQVLRLASRAAEGRIGLTAAQLFVLQKLGAEPAMSVNDLAARTSTHQSSVSVVVQRLVDKGLVRRAPSAVDRRRVELSLTPAGRRLLAKSPTAAQDQIIAALNAMNPTARRQLAAHLGELTDSMGLAGRTPPMFFEDDARARGRARPQRR